VYLDLCLKVYLRYFTQRLQYIRTLAAVKWPQAYRTKVGCSELQANATVYTAVARPEPKARAQRGQATNGSAGVHFYYFPMPRSLFSYSRVGEFVLANKRGELKG